MLPTVQNFICQGNDDPVDDDRVCRAAIVAANWWTRADVPEHWPIKTDVAVELLSIAGEFDIDADGLLDLVDRRLIARPSVGEADEFEWSASDIVHATATLQGRQQWRATPSGHDPVKHPLQLLLEQARAADEVDSIVAGIATTPRFDVRHLLELLVTSDVHEGRRKIVTLLKAVLQVDHGVVI